MTKNSMFREMSRTEVVDWLKGRALFRCFRCEDAKPYSDLHVNIDEVWCESCWEEQPEEGAPAWEDLDAVDVFDVVGKMHK